MARALDRLEAHRPRGLSLPLSGSGWMGLAAPVAAAHASCAVDAGREHSSGRPFACRCRVPSRACPVCPSVYPCLSRQRLSRTRAVLHRGVRMCTLALEPTRNEKEMPLVGAVRGVQQVAHDLGSAQGGSLVPLDPSPRGGRACEVPILLLS